MVYRLKNYKYDNFSIYKQIIWKFYKCIDKGPYSYYAGVKIINELCGIKEKKFNYSNLNLIPINNNTSGEFLTNFKNKCNNFKNDPLPAKITPYKNKLCIKWENKQNCIIDASYINIYKIKELNT